MKAAVLHHRDEAPRYEDFPDPTPGAGEILVEVKAVAVENVDRAVAAGTHYTSAEMMPELPAIPCFDGVGTLPDGRLVGFGGVRPPYGALAERAVIPEGAFAPIPEGLDPAVAVVLSSAISGMSMKLAAGLVPGETVLVQGATGVAGRLAVQVARLLGAGRIIATGRDDEQLRELGADRTINTNTKDQDLIDAYASERADVVVDFLWGRPTELLLRAMVPTSFAFPKPVRLVHIGEVAGAAISLTGDSLRTSGVEIYGAARGLSAETIGEAYGQVVSWAIAGDLTFGLVKVPLSDIEAAWRRTDLRGRRLVVQP
jgi:NADPH:quinone reductase-like Zn-dependent oxidoreductase